MNLHLNSLLNSSWICYNQFNSEINTEFCYNYCKRANAGFSTCNSLLIQMCYWAIILAPFLQASHPQSQESLPPPHSNRCRHFPPLPLPLRWQLPQAEEIQRATSSSCAARTSETPSHPACLTDPVIQTLLKVFTSKSIRSVVPGRLVGQCLRYHQTLIKCQAYQWGWNSRKLHGCHVVNPGSVVLWHHTHTLPALHISKNMPKNLVQQGRMLDRVVGVVYIQGQCRVVGWLEAVLVAV